MLWFLCNTIVSCSRRNQDREAVTSRQSSQMARKPRLTSVTYGIELGFDHTYPAYHDQAANEPAINHSQSTQTKKQKQIALSGSSRFTPLGLAFCSLPFVIHIQLEEPPFGAAAKISSWSATAVRLNRPQLLQAIMRAVYCAQSKCQLTLCSLTHK